MAYVRKCRMCKKNIHSVHEIRFDTKWEVYDYYHYHCYDYAKRHRIPLDRRRAEVPSNMNE